MVFFLVNFPFFLPARGVLIYGSRAVCFSLYVLKWCPHIGREFLFSLYESFSPFPTRSTAPKTSSLALFYFHFCGCVRYDSFGFFFWTGVPPFFNQSPAYVILSCPSRKATSLNLESFQDDKVFVSSNNIPSSFVLFNSHPLLSGDFLHRATFFFKISPPLGLGYCAVIGIPPSSRFPLLSPFFTACRPPFPGTNRTATIQGFLLTPF